MTDLEKTEALKPGDPCEFRFPARTTWLKGTVVKNGGSGYWTIRCVSSAIEHGLYIEYVRAPGTDPWGH